MNDKNGKTDRILGIYTRLINGDVVNKEKETNRYSINERSIQRDIDDIRTFLFRKWLLSHILWVSKS